MYIGSENEFSDKKNKQESEPAVRKKRVLKPAALRMEKVRTMRIERTNSALPAALMALVERIEEETGDKLLRRNLYFSSSVYEKLMYLLKNGCTVVCDTSMTAAVMKMLFDGMENINQCCCIDDDDVKRLATLWHSTRAEVALDKGLGIPGPKLLIIGSAPKAVSKLIERNHFSPQNDIVVIAAPGGFAGVIELKEKLIESGIACVTVRGRKGGMDICRSIVKQFVLAATGNTES